MRRTSRSNMNLVKITELAEKYNWICLDYQPESYLVILHKKDIRINVWSSPKKTTVGIMKEKKWKYIYGVNSKALEKIFSV